VILPAEEFKGCFGELLAVVGDFQLVGIPRGEEPIKMFLPPEDGCSVVGIVGAGPFEDPRAVVESKDVDRRVVPVDELAVLPDRLDIARLTHLVEGCHYYSQPSATDS